MQVLEQAGKLPEPVQLTAVERDSLIMEWNQAREELEHFKQKEMALRLQLNADAAMFDPAKEKGTMRFALGNGFELLCERKLNITVENKEGEAFKLMEELTSSPDPVIVHMAKDLFKWSPELRQSKLAELEKHDKATAQKVKAILTEKPASPTLKLIEPK